MLKVMERQRTCDVRLASLAVCTLADAHYVLNEDAGEPPLASMSDPEMEARGGAEDSVATPGVDNKNVRHLHLHDSAEDNRKAMSGSPGASGYVETDPAARTTDSEADAPGGKAARDDLLLNRGACSLHASGPQDMPNKAVPSGDCRTTTVLSSQPVQADAVLPQCEHRPATVLDLVSRCKALAGVAAMSCTALQGQNGSCGTAQDFLQSAGISVEWILFVITDISWRFRALSGHMDPSLYRGLLAMALKSVGEISWVLDAVAACDAELKPSGECRTASKALMDEMWQCLAAEVARVEGTVPLASSLQNGLPRQAHIDSLQSGSASPACHLVLTVKAMVLLGVTERQITALLRQTTPLVMNSRRSTTVGDLLRLHGKYNICDYDCHDHYFSLVVELRSRGQGIQRSHGQLQVLDIAAHALRVQYLPCEAACQVIADLAVSSVDDCQLHVRTLSCMRVSA